MVQAVLMTRHVTHISRVASLVTSLNGDCLNKTLNGLRSKRPRMLVARKLGRDQLQIEINYKSTDRGDSVAPLPLTSSFCFLLSLQFSDRTLTTMVPSNELNNCGRLYSNNTFSHKEQRQRSQ